MQGGGPVTNGLNDITNMLLDDDVASNSSLTNGGRCRNSPGWTGGYAFGFVACPGGGVLMALIVRSTFTFLTSTPRPV
jgi:hypothetical protein